MAIIELGCGLRVPSVRWQMDDILTTCAHVEMFRVNPGSDELMTKADHMHLIQKGGKDFFEGLAKFM